MKDAFSFMHACSELGSLVLRARWDPYMYGAWGPEGIHINSKGSISTRWEPGDPCLACPGQACPGQAYPGLVPGLSTPGRSRPGQARPVQAWPVQAWPCLGPQLGTLWASSLGPGGSCPGPMWAAWGLLGRSWEPLGAPAWGPLCEQYQVVN